MFKSAIGWLTRPPADMRRVFGGKLVAVIGVALGAFGTILGPNAWLPVLSKIGTEPWFGDGRMVSRAHEAFDANGTLVGSAVEGPLRKFLAEFVGFVQSRHE